MGSIAEDFLKEILKFIFGVLLGWFLFWTGEAIITVLSCGFHRPRWRGYSSTGALKWVFADAALVFTGFAFWLVSFPIAYDLLAKHYLITG